MKPQLTNKEISWLSFNERVLQEAKDDRVPLIERLRFLGIFSSNLDEFFRIRVATLKRISQLGRKASEIIGHNPKEILKQIEKIVVKQQKVFDRTYRELLKEMKSKNIHILDEKKLSQKQVDFVQNYFDREVRPSIMPIMMDQIKKFPALNDKSVYLAVCLYSNKKSKKNKYALIEIPTAEHGRFVNLPSVNKNKYIILLDDVIRFGLNRVFNRFEYDSVKAYTIKITKDADFDVDGDFTESQLEKVTKGLKKRKSGQPVRFIYDENMDASMLNFFLKKLKLNKDDASIPGSKYHNFKDFIKFPHFGIKSFCHPRFVPVIHPSFGHNNSLLEAVRRQDVLLHHPYHSFEHVIDFLREASIDPYVTSIKICLYRLANKSKVINALLNAAKNGKKVTAVLELQARFDEEANIHWSNTLREGGVKVLYGHPSLKVHSKICFVTQKVGRSIHNYSIVGTGNYNEDTSKIYGDHTLFTSNKKIANDIKKVFDILKNHYQLAEIRNLIVSPFDTRRKMLRFIENEIKNKQAGKSASIFLKMNNLVDDQIIQKLYEASEHGVDVRLIIRGMFCFPDIWQASTHFSAISIVDKFLEHSRVYAFHNNGDPQVFISSADMMQRNLDKRIEVTCPIYDESIKKELLDVLEIQWSDNVKARVLNNSMSNRYVRHKTGKAIRSQLAIHNYLKRLSQS